MNKKLLSLLLAMAMLLALTACGGKEEPAEETEEQVEEPVSEEEVEVVPEEETGTDVETVEPEPSEQPENLPADPAEKPEVNNKPTDPTEKPESTPVQKPVENVPAQPQTPVQPETPADSQSKPAASVDLTAFYESVLSASEWPAMGAMEGETLDAFYPGLSAVSTKQSVVSMAMMGAVVAEIALVEVQNAADVETVKAIFQARIDYQVGDDTNPGGAWYPDSIEGWKNNSRIVSNGNYVMMVAYEGTDNVVASFNALFA